MKNDCLELLELSPTARGMSTLGKTVAASTNGNICMSRDPFQVHTKGHSPGAHKQKCIPLPTRHTHVHSCTY